MEALNKNERARSFWKFLALFLGVLVLAIAAVFVNYKVPYVENEILRNANEKLEAQISNDVGFYQKLDTVKQLLDKINNPGENVIYFDQFVSSTLVDMGKNLNDTTAKREFYSNIIALCLELQKSKKQLRDLGGASKDVESYKADIEKLSRDLDQAKRDLDICRLQLGNK
jgi:DNA repair ATPase RecN